MADADFTAQTISEKILNSEIVFLIFFLNFLTQRRKRLNQYLPES